MGVVKGKNVVLMHESKSVACIRTYTDTTAISFIETTTVGDGTNATFKPQKNTSTASLEGVVFLGDPVKWTYPELKQKALDHDLFKNASTIIIDEDGNESVETFDFYISNISRTGAVGDFNTFQIDLQITGPIVIS